MRLPFTSHVRGPRRDARPRRWRRRISIAAATASFAAACAQPNDDASRSREELAQVTIYVSTDRVFSEPVLAEYQRRTGVLVGAVYDTEETKSTGLANRLLAEKERPRADVFWSNEPVRTLVLDARGVLGSYESPSAAGIPTTFKSADRRWTGFSARLRVIVYNTMLVKREDAPTSVLDLADPKWKGQVAIADPRFGSTSFHAAALYAELGDEKADAFFQQLRANDVKVVNGNSIVRDMVAGGEVKVGLTDTDDVNVALENRAPVAMVLPDRLGMGVPVMPNMVSLIANAPHAEQGKKLIDYLLSAEVERVLAASEAVQIPLHAGVPPPKNLPAIGSFKAMTLDYAKSANRVEEVTARLQRILGL